MLIDTASAMKIHRHRQDEMRAAAQAARLAAELSPRSHTIRLGTYKLIIAKETSAHVPRLV